MRLMDVNLCSESATVITASSADPSFPASNLKQASRTKRLRTATGTKTLQVVFDMQTTEAVDSVVLLWPKEDGIKLTDSAVVRIQANATDVWTSPAVNQVLTVDDTYMMASHYFATDQSYRYWRVTIEDASNPWNYVELGVAWIGKSLDLDPAENGFTFGLVDRSKIQENDFGHKYVDEYPTQAVVEFSYTYMEYADVQILENAFRRNGARKPVMVVLDPLETVFNKNHYAVYGTMSNRFGMSHVVHALANIDGIRVEELS